MTEAQLSAWAKEAKAMVGQIPGLSKLEINKPLPSTAHRGQGFDMALVAILEKADDVQVYAEHRAHLEYVMCHSLPSDVLCWRTVSYRQSKADMCVIEFRSGERNCVRRPWHMTWSTRNKAARYGGEANDLDIANDQCKVPWVGNVGS